MRPEGWLNLTESSQLNELDQLSFQQKIKGYVVFKHSTRCGISSMALNRFKTAWRPTEDVPILYLDLLKFRSISNQLANQLNITHESPQVIAIKAGKPVYHNSHFQISAQEAINAVQ